MDTPQTTTGHHLAKARELLAMAPLAMPSNDQQLNAAVAQVHATLALSEQVAMVRAELGKMRP